MRPPAESIEQLQRQNRELAALQQVAEAGTDKDLDRLIPELLGILARFTRSDRAVIYWLSPDGCSLEYAGAFSNSKRVPPDYRTVAVSDTQIGRSVLERRVLSVVTQELAESPLKRMYRNSGIEAVATMPVLVRSRNIGALALVRTQRRPFVDDEVRSAQLLAGQIAVQLENARLHADSQRRIRELNQFLEISRLVSASLDLRSILEASSASITRLINASNAFIWLLDPQEEGMMQIIATSDPVASPLIAAAGRPLDESTVGGRTILSRRPVRLEDIEKDTRYHPLTHVSGFRSLLGIPLIAREEVIGAVVIGQRDIPRVWTDAEVESATAMAAQIAVAISNAQLYEQLNHSYDELRRTQAELVKRERLATLGEVSAIVAHEVRNPLGVIFNAVGGLQRLMNPSGDAGLYLRMLREEAERLNRIIGDLLDFARPIELQRKPEDLPAIVRAAIEAAKTVAGHEASAVKLELLVDPGLPKASVDAERLRQALLNLLLNAFQAMGPSGGRLGIRIERTGAPADGVRVVVEDSGPGIDPAQVHKIFQPFFTTKAAGTGLGLSIVKRIAEAHGGEVFAQPGRGGGTAFVLRLPAES